MTMTTKTVDATVATVDATATAIVSTETPLQRAANVAGRFTPADRLCRAYCESVLATNDKGNLAIHGVDVFLPGTDVKMNTKSAPSRLLAIACTAAAMPDTAETAAFLRAILAYEGMIVRKIAQDVNEKKAASFAADTRQIKSILE